MHKVEVKFSACERKCWHVECAGKVLNTRKKKSLPKRTISAIRGSKQQGGVKVNGKLTSNIRGDVY